MKSTLRFAVAVALVSNSTLFVSAQSSAASQKHPPSVHRKQAKKASATPIETQIQQMRQELQSQIDELKADLASRDAQIEALKSQGTSRSRQLRPQLPRSTISTARFSGTRRTWTAFRHRLQIFAKKISLLVKTCSRFRAPRKLCKTTLMSQSHCATKVSRSHPGASWLEKAYGARGQ